MIDTEIEVFRADTRASRGITAERLASIASFDCAANPIPVVIGHPQSDSPAEGTISGFRLDGAKLFASLKGVSQKVVDGIKSGALLNRSMAFFGEDHEANPTPGKLAPRHLGILGGSAPGIPGMARLAESFGATEAALSFAADDAETLVVEGPPAAAWIETAAPTPIVFTAFQPKEPKMSGTEKTNEERDAEFTARENDLKAREEAAAARIKTQFDAANNAALDGLVREGKVTPAEVDGLKTAFAALDPEGEELTFGAGDKATKATAVGHILSFIAGVDKRVPIGGRQSPNTQFSADEVTDPKAYEAGVNALAAKYNLDFSAAADRFDAGERA